MIRIAEDIHLFPVWRQAINIYFISGEKSAIIDTGYGDERSIALIKSYLKALHYDLSNLSHFKYSRT